MIEDKVLELAKRINEMHLAAGLTNEEANAAESIAMTLRYLTKSAASAPSAPPVTS